MKKGFTLAEVLITLGIIGVVAALTTPTVINYFKVKKLESQFKTADSIITQALKMTMLELGYENLNDLNLNYYVSSIDNNGGEPRRNLEMINEAWEQQFKGAKRINSRVEIAHRGVKTYRILGEELPDPTSVYSNGYILPNGMFVGRISYNLNSAAPTCFHFYFDTNGPYKGPNRYGHDIFHYISVPYRWQCNPIIVISTNQDGCYWYAHNSINPAKNQYDATYNKGVWGYRIWGSFPKYASKPDNYWDTLFKTKNYWEGK